MYIIDVIPITKGVSKEYLSYYTSQSVTIGSLVTVPVRKKTITALVTHIANVKEKKAELRSSSYTIKKVKELHTSSFLDDAVITASKRCATYFATTTGRILNTCIPKAILENIENTHPPHATKESTATHQGLILQTESNDRLAHYKSLIREDFAQKKSVFFCVSTVEEAYTASSVLQKGIESYTYILHGKCSKKEIQRIWNEILETPHSVLVIATPSFLILPRSDIATLIIEHESSTHYKQLSAPFIDLRVFAEYIAQERNIRLLYGDTLLRIETLWRYYNNELIEYTPLKHRSLTTAHTDVVDMREEIGSDTKDGFRIFSDQLTELIEHTHTSKEHLLIYASRKGLSSVTVCGDCGEAVACHNCGNSVVLHMPTENTSEHNFFQCHACGTRSSAHTTCASCGSWRLTPLGIGTERVMKSLQHLIPEDTIFIVDSDHTRTYKQARATIESFINTPGSVLVSTEMGLSHLPNSIENTAIASLDSLFSIPDFRIHERIMSTILTLRSTSEKTLLIQTRQIQQPVLQDAISGDLMQFYRNEISVREQFSYPPFSIFIKITRRGKRERVEHDMRNLEQKLGKDVITIYPSSQTNKSYYYMNGLIKIPRNAWPDSSLCTFLCSLPPQFIINVDPHNTL